MSIVNEYAIYILIKLCTSGVKECHSEYPSHSVYIIVMYLNHLLFGMSQPHPLNAISQPYTTLKILPHAWQNTQNQCI